MSYQILVVDDFPDAAAALVRVLRLHGHDVHGARSGGEARAYLATHRPDVCLFDVELPDVSGFELAREVRRAPGGSRPYLVAITGWGDARVRDDALAAGFDLHVVKPLDATALADIVRGAGALLAQRGT